MFVEFKLRPTTDATQVVLMEINMRTTIYGPRTVQIHIQVTYEKCEKKISEQCPKFSATEFSYNARFSLEACIYDITASRFIVFS